MMTRGSARILAVLLLAPFGVVAGPLTFTVQSEVHVDVRAPLHHADEVWCHVWLRTGPADSDLELSNLKATAVARNRYVCKPSVFFRWGKADSYKDGGAQIVYGADIVDANRQSRRARDPNGRRQPNGTRQPNGRRQVIELGPSLYPPPPAKTIMDLPVVTLHL